MTSDTRKKKGIEPQEKPRCTGLISFGADIRRLVAPVLGKKGMLQADVLAHWQDILGSELASGITPHSISFSARKEGAILTVKAYSGAYAVEFASRKEQIRERLNFYFGYPAISDIRVMQGGSFTPPCPKQESDNVLPPNSEELQRLAIGIEDETLRETLIRLGRLLNATKKG